MKTIRTAKNRKRFLAAIAESGNITAACEAARLSRAAAYEWRADDPSFAVEWDAALERGLDSLEDELMRRAKDGTLRPVFQGGELVGHIREYSDSSASSCSRVAVGTSTATGSSSNSGSAWRPRPHQAGLRD